MTTDKLTVPPGTRVLHVGPHKTGTTTLQGAFHRARKKLEAHDVVYAGKGRQPAHAAAAIAGGTPVGSLTAPNLRHWEQLCEEVAAAGDKSVVISSERFANADEAVARAVVDGLGGDRVHVVVTLRPLVKIMASQWQEYVKTGTRASYENWLKGMLLEPPFDKPTPSFWRRHRAHELVQRWADAVGAENLTVVMVDESDPQRVLRVFEELVRLPDGLLEPERGGTANRSLTWGEVELLRQLNKDVAKRSWPHPQWGKVLREHVAKHLREAHQPSRDEPRITTPEWAVAEAVKIAEQSIEKISSLGVRVVGDLSNLAKRPSTTTLPDVQPSVPAIAAAGAAFGATLAGASLMPGGYKQGEPAQVPGPRPVESRVVGEVSSRVLLSVLRRRVVGRLGGGRRRQAASRGVRHT